MQNPLTLLFTFFCTVICSRNVLMTWLFETLKLCPGGNSLGDAASQLKSFSIFYLFVYAYVISERWGLITVNYEWLVADELFS